jgi:hypothetical protein
MLLINDNIKNFYIISFIKDTVKIEDTFLYTLLILSYRIFIILLIKF